MNAGERINRRGNAVPRFARRLVIPIIAVLVVYGFTTRATLMGFFGPPATKLSEEYRNDASEAGFDHSAFDRILAEHVDEHGWVGYARLARNHTTLDEYIQSLGEAPFDRMDRDEKLALLINAYNAFTLRLILDFYPIDSIRDIPSTKRWKHSRWKIGARTWSLNQIEHEQIRPKFVEPRIHFALVCAAVGCPRLRAEAYQPDRIEEQLEDQTRYAHAHDRWFRIDDRGETVYLTKLFDWYGGDFKQVSGSVLEYAAKYSTALRQTLDSGNKPRIRWLDYDWKLNDKTNAP